MKIAEPMPGTATSTAGKPNDNTAWQALRLLSFYRAILAGLLAAMYFTLPNTDPFNVQAPQLFSATIVSWLLFAIAAGFTTRLRWPAYTVQAPLQVLADILAIAALMHASGGVTSSLGALLLIAVATGSLLFPGRRAYLFAAVATLALLFETGLATLTLQQTGADNLTRAGLLGLVLFATAGIAQVLAVRARESEALALQRGIDLANLEQLNQYIIQQLQSGVLVIAPDGAVRLANDTARQLLGLETNDGLALGSIAPNLAEQLKRWRQNRHWQPEPIPCRTSNSTLVPRFSPLQTSRGTGALILLEDSSQLAQQTQQIKLASLGRLTASIAHEIRNPLGAISHAAQLLEESEQLDPGDKRLTEIIGNHTRRVNTIIENVLQLSRRSASQPQTVLLQDWLRQFHDDFVQTEAIPPDHLAIVTRPDKILVEADPGQLHQIMTNLCQNAFRHSGQDARVVLRAMTGETGVTHLDVSDNGPGIDDETATQMFEPFYTTSTAGSGLGLYIARELCEINQARLSYLPSPEGGSCFRIHFAAEPNT